MSVLRDGGGWASRGAIGRGGPNGLDGGSRRFDIVRADGKMGCIGRLRMFVSRVPSSSDRPVVMEYGRAELYIPKWAGDMVLSEAGTAEFDLE